MEARIEPDSSHDEISGYSSPSSIPFKDSSSNSSLHSEDILLRRAICKISEIHPNTMRAFEFENRKIVLAYQRRTFHAVGALCTHCGHSLIDGTLGKGRIRCPHCGACFSLVTGDIEDSPAINLLQCYRVDVEDDTVYVSMEQRDLEYGSKLVLIPTMKPIKTHNKQKISEQFVVIGGGPCAALCIEQLRLLGFTGRLIAFMKEPYLPYDRTILSKYLHIDTSLLLLRTQWFYDQMEVEIFPSTTVQHVNVEDRTLIRSDGGVTSFDKVFIATGCEAKRLSLEIPGVADATGIFYVRTISDMHEIQESLDEDIDLVVVGSSYLGMELTATCLPYVKSITVISDSAFPFQTCFGTTVGKRLLKLYTDMGVAMRMSDEIVKIVMNNDTLAITGIVLRDDSLLPAQMVIVCIGVKYNTGFLANSDVLLSSDGAVLVDQYLNTNVPFVFAGGDVACAPLHPFFNTSTPTGHYQSAHMHGRVAAANMLGIAAPVQTIPFVTVALGRVTLEYVGWIKHPEDMVLVGSLDDLKFAAYYLNGDLVTAIVTCGLEGLAAKFTETIHMEKYVSRDSLHNHIWTQRMFTCPVHERNEDYELDIDKMRDMGIVF